MTRQNLLDNYSLWRPASKKGFYESYFLRGNCPEGGRAFWIKHTIFAPKGNPAAAEGELWAVYFRDLDGNKVAVKETYPLGSCLFAADRFEVRVGQAHLTDGISVGSCAGGTGGRIAWDLRYPTEGPPLHFLPPWAYRAGFPKAKAKAPYPDVVWEGTLTVDGEKIDVTGWQGSQNHNWGERHTDQYVWGQTNSFKGAPNTYAEMASARLRLGPFWTPYFSFLVLHYRGQDILFNDVGSLVRARVRFPSRFEWHVDLDNGLYQARCRVAGKKETFAGLRYRNPPGGEHACLNSKIASTEITLLRNGEEIETLQSDFNSAFEVLTDETDHGVPLLV